ncbi:hypothetical protein MCEMSE15_01470 [Fimbriimonadaceae bacterium]
MKSRISVTRTGSVESIVISAFLVWLGCYIPSQPAWGVQLFGVFAILFSIFHLPAVLAERPVVGLRASYHVYPLLFLLAMLLKR